jgi:hypothetical protein
LSIAIVIVHSANEQVARSIGLPGFIRGNLKMAIGLATICGSAHGASAHATRTTVPISASSVSPTAADLKNREKTARVLAEAATSLDAAKVENEAAAKESMAASMRYLTAQGQPGAAERHRLRLEKKAAQSRRERTAVVVAARRREFDLALSNFQNIA